MILSYIWKHPNALNSTNPTLPLESLRLQPFWNHTLIHSNTRAQIKCLLPPVTSDTNNARHMCNHMIINTILLKIIITSRTNQHISSASRWQAYAHSAHGVFCQRKCSPASQPAKRDLCLSSCRHNYISYTEPGWHTIYYRCEKMWVSFSISWSITGSRVNRRKQHTDTHALRSFWSGVVVAAAGN